MPARVAPLPLTPPAVITFAGPRDRYQSALALQEHAALSLLVTDAYFSPGWATTKILGRQFHRYAGVRHHPQIPTTRVKGSWRATFRAVLARFDKRKDSAHFAVADRLLSQIAGEEALRRGAPLIAYSYYATAAFEQMRGSGLPRILFQVHPHGRFLRDLFTQEIAKVPEARASLMEETEMSPLFEENDRAFEQADAVICASSFTRHSLIEAGSKAPAFIAGYGVDAELFAPRSAPPSAAALTIGFVGALSQRKGARYLLAALAGLPKGSARLILYTRAAVDRELIRGFEDVEVEVRGGLSDAALAADLKHCDLVVLPSIAEGFGLVILEAMACGVPVLCTTSTGGADFIAHGLDGLVVAPGSTSAIHEQFVWALSHRDQLFQMGQAARRKAELHSWAEYRRKFFTAYTSAIRP